MVCEVLPARSRGTDRAPDRLGCYLVTPGHLGRGLMKCPRTDACLVNRTTQRVVSWKYATTFLRVTLRLRFCWVLRGRRIVSLDLSSCKFHK